MVLTYDAGGNRKNETLTAGATTAIKSYTWTGLNRLNQVTMPNGASYAYLYDYRMRRIVDRLTPTSIRQVVYSGGLGVQEYVGTTTVISNPATPTVENQRADGMGGGVGGMLYSIRSGQTKFSLSNGRGDVVAQSDSTGAFTWTASYEAFGKRTKETGINLDRQRANTKEEDPTGLLNEGFRYRDLETGVWLSRDPAGFVDGPNLYAYVLQNPWTSFDPDGLYLRDIYNFLDQDVAVPVAKFTARLADATIATIGGFCAGREQQQYHQKPCQIFGTIEKPTEQLIAERSDRGGELIDTFGALVVPEVKGGKSGISPGERATAWGARFRDVGMTPEATAKQNALPKGGNNAITQAAAVNGSKLHADKPGMLPEQLRAKMPDTQLDFTPPGKRSQDVTVTGGAHPSEYPGSTWPVGVNKGDFKPDTLSGIKTFIRDLSKKWNNEPTVRIPYDPKTGKLK